MSKRCCSDLDKSLEPPPKRQKLMEEEKDSENAEKTNEIETGKKYRTVTINEECESFLSSDLIKIDFFNSRYSSNWHKNTQNQAQNECIIDCDFIKFGITELKMAIKYLSNQNNLCVLSDYDLFSSSNNFSKLVSFLECLDFFCISSCININILCDYYYNIKHSKKITISDLFTLQHSKNKLLHLTSVKLIKNIYSSTMNERILSLKENILKFKIDIDSGFIIKDDRDASDWFNKKINEFCLYRKYLSRDWIIIEKSHESLQRLFILNDLHDPIITSIKDILSTFCRFCTMSHMKHINNMSNDVINIDLEQRKKSNVLNDVKICTFPIIQLMSIFLFYIKTFNVVYVKNKTMHMDLITLLPTILKCDLFCGLNNDKNEEYKHCNRDDDLRFINIVYNNNQEKNLYKAMIKIYKDIINILLDPKQFDIKCLNNDLSIIETLILPITHKIMDDQEWILNLLSKSKQKETILLASKLRNLILDLQLDGHHVNYSYMENIELYLSHK